MKVRTCDRWLLVEGADVSSPQSPAAAVAVGKDTGAPTALEGPGVTEMGGCAACAAVQPMTSDFLHTLFYMS